MTHPSTRPILPPPRTRGRRLLALLVLAVAGWIASSPAPARADNEPLQRSVEMRQQFPFQARCDGNTQEMVACLWDRRNREDQVLGELLGDKGRLEEWRASRRRVCEVVAQKGKGGSIHPILWLSCENRLNHALIRLLKQPLLHNAGP